MKRSRKTRLTRRLLAAPARHSVRRVAQVLLDNVKRERGRLGHSRTALHDFRVALRRLRTWLRAYKSWLDDSVGGRSYRALRDLADASNRARDSEVALVWLAAQGDLSVEEAAARPVLESAWRREQRGATRKFDRRLAARYDIASGRLEKQLAHYRVSVVTSAPAKDPAARAVVADALGAQVLRVEKALGRIRSVADAVEAHQARIAGKHLRYLIEPLVRDPRAKQLVDRLTALQDVLGDFHDAHQVIDRLARTPAAAAAEHALGLEALTRRAQERAVACFENVGREWRGDGLATFTADVVALAERVRQAHPPADEVVRAG
jgi:CHAD domain-containing protein